MRPARQFFPVFALLALCLASACAPTVAVRGQIVDDEQLDQIEPGVSTREDVASVLGSPSTTATFSDSTWYYIGQTTEKTAFFDPEVTDRKIVAVTFDDAGLVQGVQRMDREDSKVVELSDRRTPTKGKDVTIFQQLLGNLGKFAPPAGKK
ncbi:MAG: outer membrane protein assembly factor BamE [Pseudomonadota bacterium]|nr:outer membrane protein assembly factor BamE [Pseudomonadota bacterium]